MRTGVSHVVPMLSLGYRLCDAESIFRCDTLLRRRHLGPNTKPSSGTFSNDCRPWGSNAPARSNFDRYPSTDRTLELHGEVYRKATSVRHLLRNRFLVFDEESPLVSYYTNRYRSEYEDRSSFDDTIAEEEIRIGILDRVHLALLKLLCSTFVGTCCVCDAQ